MSAPVQVGPSPTGGGPVPSLTDRELALLAHMAKGDTYEIAARSLDCAERTASWIGQQVMQKLGAHSIAHAVDAAYQRGVLRLKLDQDQVEAWPAPLLQVLELVADGRTNADIARVLFRSEHTVADQVKEARRRLGARDRAHAAALAVALRIVSVDLTPAVPAVVDAA